MIVCTDVGGFPRLLRTFRLLVLPRVLHTNSRLPVRAGCRLFSNHDNFLTRIVISCRRFASLASTFEFAWVKMRVDLDAGRRAGNRYRVSTGAPASCASCGDEQQRRLGRRLRRAGFFIGVRRRLALAAAAVQPRRGLAGLFAGLHAAYRNSLACVVLGAENVRGLQATLAAG